MAKKPKLPPDKKVIRRIFPRELVRALENLVDEADTPTYQNPVKGGKLVRVRTP